MTILEYKRYLHWVATETQVPAGEVYGRGYERMPLEEKDGKVTPDSLLCTFLGLSQVFGMGEELNDMEKGPVMDRVKRYPFLQHSKALYEKQRDLIYHTDREKQRKLGKYAPGEIELGASGFIHYPQIWDLLDEYYGMQDLVWELLAKALESKLDDDEVNEWNYLVSFFLIADIGDPEALLYDTNLSKYKGIFPGITAQEVRDNRYLLFRKGGSVAPWTISEWVNDKGRAKEFMRRFPDSIFLLVDSGEPSRNPGSQDACFYCKTWRDAIGDDVIAEAAEWGDRKEDILQKHEDAIRGKLRAWT